MNEIRQQVARAKRRLNLQQFLRIAPWVLFVCLCMATLGVAVPKLWPLSFLATEESQLVWQWSWIGGALAVGFLVAGIWTYCVRRDALEAAIELDRRYGLKERVSSSLALTPGEMETEAGVALLDDAVRRVSNVDVRERFGVAVRWPVALPLVSAGMIALVCFLSNAVPPKTTVAADSAAKEETKKQIKKSAEELKKKLEEQKKKTEEQGLTAAADIFKKMQQELEKLNNKGETDRKEAMVKMNDLAKELEKRRDQLGGTDKLRKQLDQMKNIEKGPADKINQAMKEGDFNKAMQEAKKLQEKLEKGDLNDEEKKQLQKQLGEMQNKLQEMKNAHEQAKQDLKEQIEKKQKAGDLAGAGKLQQQLEQMEKQDKQMDKMQKMADKLAKAEQAMKEGNNKEAANQLAQLGEDLKEMQKDGDELDMLDEMMDQVADAKNSMNCKECEGEGCEQCRQGQGKGQGKMGQNGGKNKNGRPGRGMGEGRGFGERPEEETDTALYDSKVGAKPKAGEAVRTGYADGANIAGKTLKDVQQDISTSLSAEPEPLTNQRLPRAQREQAKQYFERYQPGKGNKATEE